MRESWEAYWMKTAELVASRSTCASGRKVGAIFVIDNRQLATGVNGVPAGYKHPTTCPRREQNIPSGHGLDLCVCAHAEANGIANAARTGTKIHKAICYVTCQPCAACMGALANVGVSKVIYGTPYPGVHSKQIAHQAGIILGRAGDGF